MKKKIPVKIYAPSTQDEITRQMRRGIMPASFTRRMRVINLLSMVALGKIEEPMLFPFDTMDLHHILDRQISQDAIIDQINNEPLSYALATGDLRPLWEATNRRPKLRNSFITGWASRFFEVPFDPICVMLALRVRLLLELIDDLGHSYNLLRFFPAAVFDPIPPPPIPPIPPTPPIPPVPPEPGPEPPGPVPPKDEDYVPPWWELEPDPMGLPGVSPGGGPTLGPEGPGTFDPGADPGDPGAPGPGPGAPSGPGSGPGGDWDGWGGGPNGGAPWGYGGGPGDLGGDVDGGGSTSPTGGDPCADVDDPTKTVVIGYTTLHMAVDETQKLSVDGRHPRWAGTNYHWSILEGGGELSSSFGTSVIYTSPLYNPDCELNVTIGLTCDGRLVDTVQIAINAAGDLYLAFEEKKIVGTDPSCCAYAGGSCHDDASPPSCTPARDYCGQMTYFTCIRVLCDGTIDAECSGYDWVCAYGSPSGVWEDRAHCANAMGGGTLGIATPLGITDLRTEEAMLAGCCPEELL